MADHEHVSFTSVHNPDGSLHDVHVQKIDEAFVKAAADAGMTIREYIKHLVREQVRKEKEQGEL